MGQRIARAPEEESSCQMQTSSSGSQEGGIGQRKDSTALSPMSTHLPAAIMTAAGFDLHEASQCTEYILQNLAWGSLRESVEGEIMEKHLEHWKPHQWAQQPLLPPSLGTAPYHTAHSGSSPLASLSSKR